VEPGTNFVPEIDSGTNFCTTILICTTPPRGGLVQILYQKLIVVLIFVQDLPFDRRRGLR